MVYGEPTRPPVDQERSLRVSPATMQPQTHVPLPPLEPSRFTCALPVVPPPLLTPPMPLASEGIRLLRQPSMSFMLPSAFQGGGMRVNAIANNTIGSEEQTRENRSVRTVTFQDSYDALSQSSSRDEPPK